MRNTWFFLLLVPIILSCEKNITLDLPDPTRYLVVHGHIEPDSFAYVSLSRNSPYFDPVDLGAVASLLVSNAIVVVSDGTIRDTLRPDFNFQHWTLFNYRGTKIKGQFGSSYSLEIITPEHEIFATTTIPLENSFDSIWYKTRAEFVREAGNVTPTPRDEELAQVLVRYDDPPFLGNFVRVFTKRNQETIWGSDFQSIYSDEIINGGSVEFPVDRAKEAYLFNDSLTFEEFGYFEIGDTVYLKWCTIDKAHYTFWNTLQAATGGTGNPFSTPTIVATNLKARKGAALGIWGGYGTTLDTFIVRR